MQSHKFHHCNFAGRYQNGNDYWRSAPAPVWRYKLGGYRVLKRWLFYRERSIFNRPSRPEEAQHFTDAARRITVILLYGRDAG